MQTAVGSRSHRMHAPKKIPLRSMKMIIFYISTPQMWGPQDLVSLLFVILFLVEKVIQCRNRDRGRLED